MRSYPNSFPPGTPHVDELEAQHDRRSDADGDCRSTGMADETPLGSVVNWADVDAMWVEEQTRRDAAAQGDGSDPPTSGAVLPPVQQWPDAVLIGAVAAADEAGFDALLDVLSAELLRRMDAPAPLPRFIVLPKTDAEHRLHYWVTDTHAERYGLPRLVRPFPKHKDALDCAAQMQAYIALGWQRRGERRDNVA